MRGGLCSRHSLCKFGFASASCVVGLDVITSPDALGLLVDLFGDDGVLAVARAAAVEEIVGVASCKNDRTALAVCFDDCVSVAGCCSCRMESLGTRASVAGPWIDVARCNRRRDCRNCRDCDIFVVAVV